MFTGLCAGGTGVGVVDVTLGWELQFFVPIPKTPIGSRIPILFLILNILGGFFSEFHF